MKCNNLCLSSVFLNSGRAIAGFHCSNNRVIGLVVTSFSSVPKKSSGEIMLCSYGVTILDPKLFVLIDQIFLPRAFVFFMFPECKCRAQSIICKREKGKKREW